MLHLTADLKGQRLGVGVRPISSSDRMRRLDAKSTFAVNRAQQASGSQSWLQDGKTDGAGLQRDLDCALVDCSITRVVSGNKDL